MSIDDLYKEPPRPSLYCSFCGKSQHEVRKLLAADSVYICSECVDLCHEIVHPPGELIAIAKAIADRSARA